MNVCHGYSVNAGSFGATIDIALDLSTERDYSSVHVDHTCTFRKQLDQTVLPQPLFSVDPLVQLRLSVPWNTFYSVTRLFPGHVRDP